MRGGGTLRSPAGYRSARGLDRRGRAEILTVRPQGADGHVLRRARGGQVRLEAASRNRAAFGHEDVRVRAGEDLPLSDRGRAVPARPDVGRPARARSRHVRRSVRLRVPGVAEGAVGVVAWLEAGAEDDVALEVELGELRVVAAPAHEHVLRVPEHLHAALTARVEGPRIVV